MTNVILKVVTGIVLLPTAIILHLLWPWWENKETKLWKRILIAPFVIPAWILMYLVSEWYEEVYKI